MNRRRSAPKTGSGVGFTAACYHKQVIPVPLALKHKEQRWEKASKVLEVPAVVNAFTWLPKSSNKKNAYNCLLLYPCYKMRILRTLWKDFAAWQVHLEQGCKPIRRINLSSNSSYKSRTILARLDTAVGQAHPSLRPCAKTWPDRPIVHQGISKPNQT